MNKIQYNVGTLNIIRQLANLKKKIIFKRNGDKVILNSGNISDTIVYQLEMPSSHFDIPGEECTFLDYIEFYGLFNLLPECELYENDDLLIISKDRTKFSYLIADPSIMFEQEDDDTSDYFSGVDFSESAFRIEFSINDIKNFRKFINNAGVNISKVQIKDNSCTFKFYSKKHVNCFEHEFLNLKDNIGDFEFELSKDIFYSLPERDYYIDINHHGLIRFQLISEDINLSIYTGALEEE